jgi:hypothetical protein
MISLQLSHLTQSPSGILTFFADASWAVVAGRSFLNQAMILLTDSSEFTVKRSYSGRHSRESGNPWAFQRLIQNGFPIEAFGNDSLVLL